MMRLTVYGIALALVTMAVTLPTAFLLQHTATFFAQHVQIKVIAQ